ncbi:response regulator [Aestuariibacter salexigens]|uniref:response regulator n=1 Tax=Aestuariibacter salexigens TaxID=226010 RepID=UPI00041D9FE8|nr:response regulator [Aestuariibacter salexigens]
MAQLSLRDKRILLVEDQRPFLILLRGIVSNLGAKSVVTAQSSEAAITSCKNERFDFIICDLHLGSDRKNGFQLLEEIRLRKLVKPTTVFIMISADSERPMVLGSLEKQPDEYLIKPFSQAQLQNRIARAFAKKQALAPVYERIMMSDYKAAIEVCRDLIKSGNRYSQACSQLLAEMYWRTKQYDEAEHMLKALLEHKPLNWVKLCMARTMLLKKKYMEASNFANQVIKANKLTVEGYDILAQCYLHQDMKIDAEKTINRALELSPMSLDRHFIACEIARDNHNYDMLKTSCQAIWEQSKRSIHRDVAHLCTYIRSIVDIAEHSDEKRKKNRAQQEAMLVLQRSRTDEAVLRLEDDFDYDSFEQIISARISVIDGKLIEAKRNLATSQRQIETKFQHYPIALAPDSIKVMFDLGEYEEASSLLSLIEKNEKPLDRNTLAMVSDEKNKSAKQQSMYSKHNGDGMRLFNEGKYEAALDEFRKAQQIAPVNTSVAINMLQSILKILDMRHKVDYALVGELKKTYRLLDGLPLNSRHQQKLDEIQHEITQYLEQK